MKSESRETRMATGLNQKSRFQKAPSHQNKEGIEQMQYKDTKKIMIDQRKLETLFRIGCPDNLIIELLKTKTFTPTGDSLIDDNLETLLDYRYFVNNGWGGKRNGAGRKSQKTSKNNHLENQDENQLDNQDANQNKIKFVDKDIDIDNNISEIKNNRFINEFTLFKAGFQDWTFPPEIRKVATQHWSADEIRNIEKDFSCQEYQTEITINDLLQTYPPKPKTTRFVKPTVEEIKAYCQERNNSVDSDSFFNYYESKGWLIGKTPMKDWKAAVRTWEKHNYNQPKKESFAFTTDSTKSFLNDENGGF